MSYDAEISIFGHVANPEAIWDLANGASAEAKIGWLYDLKATDFLGYLQRSEEDEKPLVLTGRGLFEILRQECQAANLAYVMRFGVKGDDGFTNGISWRPGMDNEFSFLIRGEGLAIKIEDVQAAAARGIDAVNNLVASVEALNQVGKITIEPGFLEAYEEYAGPSPVAPAARKP